MPWERGKSRRKTPVITEEVKEFVRNCLEEDRIAPRKQRHTSHTRRRAGNAKSRSFPDY